jgi:HPt (histidine-containing phosphotransfer) domain-containing protein
MAALWERFRGATLERLDTLEGALRLLRAAPHAATPRADAISAAHKLAGSLGTFGFGEASRLARECDRMLENEPLTPATLDLLVVHAASIRAELG